MVVESFPANPTTFTPSQPRESCRARKATLRFIDGKLATYLPRLASALGIGLTYLTYNSNAASTDVDDDTNPLLDSVTTWDEMQAPDSAMVIQEACIFSAVELRRSERARQASKRFLEGDMGARMPRLSKALGVASSDGYDG